MMWRWSTKSIVGMLFGGLFLCLDHGWAQDTGWTSHPFHSSGRTIYVSSSRGNDGFTGRSPSQAVRTLSRAKSLMRTGRPDRLLLKTGDAWNETFGDWGRSGLSAAYPMIIGAYGNGPRPIVRPGDNFGFRVMNVPAHHVAIVGIHFQADPKPLAPREAGITLLGPASDILIEDCFLEGFSVNISLQGFAGPLSDVRIRRCVIVDAVNARSYAHGIYADTMTGLLVEECLLDYNGWRDGVFPKSQFNRNVYIQWDCEDVVFRGNITTRSSSAGASIRSGGIVDDNLCVANPIGIGLGSTSPKAKAGGISGAIRNNVVLHSNDIESWAHGLGLWVSNVTPLNSLEISRNIIAHEKSTGEGRAINISASDDPVFNAMISDNIVYDFGEVLNISGDGLGDNAVHGNLFSVTNKKSYLVSCRDTRLFDPAQVRYARNHWRSNHSIWFHNAYTNGAKLVQQWYTYKQWVALSEEVRPSGGAILYNDPKRTVESYHESLGGKGTLEAFLDEARQQSRSNWRESYTAAAVNGYIRDGFGFAFAKISGDGYQQLDEPLALSVADVPQDMAVQWSKDGTDIPGATSPNLTIDSAQLDDSGDYTVTVTDADSSQTVGPANVAVVTSLPALSTLLVLLLTLLTGGAGVLALPSQRNGYRK